MHVKTISKPNVKRQSEISINEFKRIELHEGNVTGSVVKQKNGDKITVACNVGIVTVIGTQFEVQQLGNHTEVSVLSGSVTYQSTNSEDLFTIHAGEDYKFINEDQRFKTEAWATGSVIGIGAEARNIRIKNASGSKVYTPLWVGCQGGGPDPDVRKVLNRLEEGDSVRFQWSLDERLRINHIEKLR